MAAANILAELVRRGGSRLLNRAVDQTLPGDRKPTLLKGLAGAALVRVATRSVPGAIVVGGGLLAKTLYDRRRAKAQPKTSTDPKG